MVRKMKPEEAIDILAITPKAAAQTLQYALKTALSNAKQKGMDLQNINVKSLEINESMKMKRFRAGTRGRIKPYAKRMSHIKIVLSDDLKLKTLASSSTSRSGQNSNIKTEAKNSKLKKEKGGK